VFAAILDDTKGGRFQIAPIEPDVSSKQFYLPDTNILVTRFLSGEVAGEVCDLMPVTPTEESMHPHCLIRRVAVVRGMMRFRVTCRPAFDYGRARHEVELGPTAAQFRSPALGLSLATEIPMRVDGEAVTADFALTQGQAATFLVQESRGPTGCRKPPSEAEFQEIFRATMAFWQGWVARSTYRGRWMVNRSALVLKLLAFVPTGAIVASPTTSLPGGELAGDGPGTTGTPGSATRALPSTRYSRSASPKRRTASWSGCRLA
jgi:GH15 family glucan-1,4-alpha-glucosidase